MDQSLLLFISLILIWSVKPFLKKFTGRKLSAFEFTIMNSIVYISIVMLTWALNPQLVEVSKFSQLTAYEVGSIIVLGVISVTSSFIFQYLVKKYDVSYLLPHIQPVVLSVTLLFSYFYGEQLSIQKMGGVAFVVLGLFFINK